MGQTSPLISHLSAEGNKILDGVRSLKASNRRLRSIALFQGFVIVLLFFGLASLADWRVTVTGYAIALCYLPFFARR